ncbi:MAG: hypothetical protein HY319_29325 [Armatimonadetes bacterium]|nr:hypothetical protein [Armatimonadota bacterium]
MRTWLILLAAVLCCGCGGKPVPASSPTPVPSSSPPVPVGDPKFTSVRPDLLEIDVRRLMRLHSSQDIGKARDTLAEFVWGDADRLRKLRPSRTMAVQDKTYSALPEVAAVERIEIEQEHELRAVANHLRPRAASTGQVVIFHGGHEDVFEHRDAIRGLLAEGHSVVAMDMPLCGRNPRPMVEVPGFGPIWLLLHDQLWLLPGEGAPQRFFLGPVAAVTNHLEGKYRRIAMAGFSGGGWATTVYSALDPRIERSYPVAGSLPLFLRDWAREAGDREQWDPDFYRLANYLELYVMAASGKGRRQVQMLNQYDDWSFYGVRWKIYAEPVDNLVRQLKSGGEFKVSVDTATRAHALSPLHLQWILEDLRS